MGDEDDGAEEVSIDRHTARDLVAAIRGTAETNRVIVLLEERVEALKEEVRKHRRLLYEGNGRSVVTRLEIVETSISDRREVTAADRTGRWSFWASLVGGLFGLGGALVAIFKN